MKKLAVVLLLAGVMSCGQGANNPQVVDPTAEAGERGETRDGKFERDRQISIEWQSTVADIEPTSRFRDPIGGSDTATISTSLLLSERADQETRSYFEGLEGVEAEFDESERLVQMTYRTAVEEDAEQDGRYRFEIAMPHEFADLKKEGDVGLTVLLPRPAKGYEDEPGYDVRLVPPDKDDAAQVFEPEEESQRISLHFYDRQDPVWRIIYDLLS